MFGLFNKPKTRTLREIDAEMVKLAKNRDNIDPAILPQLNMEINIKMAMLNVLQWYHRADKVPTLGFDSDALKLQTKITRQFLAEKSNKKNATAD